MEKNNYLMNDNAAIAESRIEQLETRFIRPLNAVASGIRAIGGEVTKDTLKDALYNDCEEIRNAYFERNGLTGELSLSDKLVAERANNQVDEIRTAAGEINGVLTFGVNLKDPDLFNWFELDENGNAVLNDSKKDEIRAAVVDVVKTTIGKQLVDLQHKIAGDLQKFADLMQKVNNDPRKTFETTARLVQVYFPGAMFHCKDTGNGIVVTPRKINFDPVSIDD